MQSELSYDVLVGQEFPYLFIYYNIQYLITWGVINIQYLITWGVIYLFTLIYNFFILGV